MAFTAEVVARLGLDSTEFKRGLTATQADLGRIAGETSRKMKRAFGADDVFKGLLQGLGIGSVQQVVDFIAKGWERAAESAKQAAESTAQTLGIYEKLFAGRRTDEQNLDVNLRKQARLQQELKGQQDRKETVQVWNPYTQKFMAQERTIEGNAERRAEIAKELAELATEEQGLRKKIADEATKAAEQKAKIELDAVQARLDYEKQLAENADKLRTDEEKLAELQRQRAEKATLASETDYQTKLEVAKIDGEILDLEKKISEQKEKQAEEQRKQSKQLKSATSSLAQAKAEREQALLDQSGITLGDAAAGKGSASARVLARRALMLDAKARRVRRLSSYTNEAGVTMTGEEGARTIQSQANAIRGYIGELTSSEQNPLKAMEEKIGAAEEHLREINENLKPAKTK